MKTGALVGGILAVVSVVTGATGARAAEGADIETDHLDAADDGSPRTVALLVDPAAVALGQLGLEIDVAVLANVALSVEADRFSLGGLTAYGAAVGLPLFPQRFTFHGLYVHPRAAWARTSGDGPAVDVVSAGATVGYEWTWPVGATIRLGAGATYGKTVASDGGVSVALEGLRPQIDGTLGWVF
jgi:hypothetical protein